MNRYCLSPVKLCHNLIDTAKQKERVRLTMTVEHALAAPQILPLFPGPTSG